MISLQISMILWILGVGGFLLKEFVDVYNFFFISTKQIERNDNYDGELELYTDKSYSNSLN